MRLLLCSSDELGSDIAAFSDEFDEAACANKLVGTRAAFGKICCSLPFGDKRPVEGTAAVANAPAFA